ncbi:iron ABC transporter substrate-binding protein [Calothrix sp. NIES-3974]|uniref:iron ABC transporter substrate-binding protein n=1 Tax=Calothrix sp. NIES-3974 TaxID=2005462 RepID=UPI000B61038C|nr:iron ABC transporter substrate-binding protein [Calothrix sp. NIES-3974]BAZ07497.1 ABC transporter, ferric iron-binding periplasmic protein [Calothrix sp. NIES-3974]
MKKVSLTKFCAGALVAVIVGTGLGVNAQQSRTLTIYSGRNEKLIGPLIERARRDLNLNIQVRYGDTAELAIALLEEGRRSRADMFFAQDAGALGAVQQAGLTHSIPGSILNKVDSRYRSRSGNWMGITARARVINYNTRLVKPAELPRTVAELTQPKWRGKVGWAPTNGSFQSFITAMRKLEGDQKTIEWLRGMKANGVKDYGRNTAIVEAVGKGEIHLGLVNNYYLGQIKRTNPNIPVAAHYTRRDAGAIVNIAGVAVLRTTDQRADVERLINYLLSPSSQNYFAEETTEYPLIRGAKAPAGQIPLGRLNPPRLDLNELSDLQGTLRVLKQAGVL